MSVYRNIIIFSLLMVSSCTTLNLVSPKKEGYVVLGSSENSNCRTVGSETQWYALWGAAPINEIDISPYLQDKNKTYRIVQRVSAVDVAVTLGGGFLASISRSTVDVQECDEKVIVMSQNRSDQLNRERIDKELLRYALTQNQSAVYIKNGSMRSGKIIYMDADRIILEYTVRPEKKASEGDEEPGNRENEESQNGVEASREVVYEDHVILDNGTEFVGKISGQGTGSVIFVDGNGRREIPKDEIKNIQYQVERVVEATIKESIDRTDIDRIVFR